MGIIAEIEDTIDGLIGDNWDLFNQVDDPFMGVCSQ